MRRFLKIAGWILLSIFVLLVGAYFGLKQYYQHQSREAIEHTLQSPSTMVDGLQQAQMPVVEFFDYQCPHCLVMSKTLHEAIAEDTTIRLILRPVNVLGEESLLISSFVLASEKQKFGNALKLHEALMQREAVSGYDAVKAMATVIGIDAERAEKDAKDTAIQKEISDNTQTLQDIGFYAVPALVIGDKGYVPIHSLAGVNELRMMILDAKKRLNIE